mmetsp:Transcript_82271/g.166718  ORF Transcript_82271/g.166718 Transcript_82271/m.166718 type:complete len:212 (-) Transcript_82271:292-927(-)
MVRPNAAAIRSLSREILILFISPSQRWMQVLLCILAGGAGIPSSPTSFWRPETAPSMSHNLNHPSRSPETRLLRPSFSYITIEWIGLGWNSSTKTTRCSVDTTRHPSQLTSNRWMFPSIPAVATRISEDEKREFRSPNLSLSLVRHRLTDRMAIEVMLHECPSNTASHDPAFTFHTRVVPSSPAETSQSPQHRTLLTRSECPRRHAMDPSP